MSRISVAEARCMSDSELETARLALRRKKDVDSAWSRTAIKSEQRRRKSRAEDLASGDPGAFLRVMQ